MMVEYGHRCPDFHPGCAVCEAYFFFDKQGRAPTELELHMAIDAALRPGGPGA